MKYLFVLSSYSDYRQKIFDEIISPRNKQYCDIHGYKYVEIRKEHNPKPFRGNYTWNKFSIPLDLINSGVLKEGDILIHYDADILNVKPEISLEIPEDKSFGYSIDSGNTVCMGFWSMRVNDWSRQLIRNVMDENRWNRLKDEITIHDRFKTFSSYAQEFREQAMIHKLFGVKRHSDKSYWEYPDYGWHSDVTDECVYSLDELRDNVHVFPTEYNVTEWKGESSLQFNINPIDDKDDVILRHFTGCSWENIKSWV